MVTEMFLLKSFRGISIDMLIIQLNWIAIKLWNSSFQQKCVPSSCCRHGDGLLVLWQVAPQLQKKSTENMYFSLHTCILKAVWRPLCVIVYLLSRAQMCAVFWSVAFGGRPPEFTRLRLAVISGSTVRKSKLRAQKNFFQKLNCIFCVEFKSKLDTRK